MRSFFIAEIGVNHENSIDVAIDMVKNAKLAGADAVKFQTYKSSSLAAANSPSYWTFLVSLVLLEELFDKHECFSLDFYLPIIKACSDLGIVFSTTCLVGNWSIYLIRFLSFTRSVLLI